MKVPETEKVLNQFSITNLHKVTTMYFPLTLAIHQTEKVYDIPQEIMHRLLCKCSDDTLMHVLTRLTSRDIHHV
jgi:hypothetical protein